MFKRKMMYGGIYFRPDRDLPIEDLPAPPVVTIPLVQHKETPSRPIVKAGDHVAVGQIIGQAADDTGAPVHASVSGVVTKVSRYPYVQNPMAFSVTIENDGKDEFASPIPYDKPWTEAEPDELIGKIKLSGIIDWNGATGTPVHVKFAAAQGGKAPTLIVSFLATEPYCSADLRFCTEEIEKVAAGIALCRKIVGAARCMIVGDEKTHRMLQALFSLKDEKSLKDFSLVMIRKAKYPLHEERLVVRACTGIKTVLTTEAGCVVISAAAAAAVRAAITELAPSYQRAITVAGPALRSPKHFRQVRIGTPLRHLLEACDADFARIKKLVAGGPLSGTAIADLDTPVTKAMAALLALDHSFPAQEQARQACIGCRRCYAVCPVRLEPSRIASQIASQNASKNSRLAQAENVPELEARGVMECIECGCCAYVCPSRINLVHYLSFGKKLVQTYREKVE